MCPPEQMLKSAVKISFLADPNQKLHTNALDAGDQRPTRWSFNMKLWNKRKKSLFLKKIISWLNDFKSALKSF